MTTGDWYKFNYVSYIDGYFSDPDTRYFEDTRNVGQFLFMGSVCDSDEYTVCYNEVDSVCGAAYEGSTVWGVPDTMHYLTNDSNDGTALVEVRKPENNIVENEGTDAFRTNFEDCNDQLTVENLIVFNRIEDDIEYAGEEGNAVIWYFDAVTPTNTYFQCTTFDSLALAGTTHEATLTVNYKNPPQEFVFRCTYGCNVVTVDNFDPYTIEAGNYFVEIANQYVNYTVSVNQKLAEEGCQPEHGLSDAEYVKRVSLTYAELTLD